MQPSGFEGHSTRPGRTVLFQSDLTRRRHIHHFGAKGNGNVTHRNQVSARRGHNPLAAVIKVTLGYPSASHMCEKVLASCMVAQATELELGSVDVLQHRDSVSQNYIICS